MLSYLICYDIEDDRQRTQVAKLLEHYGQRVQYSVFEVHLSRPALREQLVAELGAIVGEQSTDLRFYRLTADALQDSQCLNGSPIGRRELVVIV
jgi:CRISPR-associated protein Cas2